MTTPFLRPAATAWLRRWGETLAAAALALLGLWWFATTAALLAWMGAALALGAGAAALAAFRTALFRRGGGVGVVQLDEGRLTYFGPLTGGTIAVGEILSVAIDPRHRPAHWVLSGAEAQLLIPVDAEGAAVLLDVFATLPGLDLQKVMTARARHLTAPTILWRRSRLTDDPRRVLAETKPMRH